MFLYNFCYCSMLKAKREKFQMDCRVGRIRTRFVMIAGVDIRKRGKLMEIEEQQLPGDKAGLLDH